MRRRNIQPPRRRPPLPEEADGERDDHSIGVHFGKVGERLDVRDFPGDDVRCRAAEHESSREFKDDRKHDRLPQFERLGADGSSESVGDIVRAFDGRGETI